MRGAGVRGEKVLEVQGFRGFRVSGFQGSEDLHAIRRMAILVTLLQRHRRYSDGLQAGRVDDLLIL